MKKSLLHIYRNSPYGRETLLQSAYCCERLQLPLDIYLPVDPHFMFYFANQKVQFDLDASYLQAPDKAKEHVEELLKGNPGLYYRFIKPIDQTAAGTPDLKPDCTIMTCPRSMTEKTSRIGLGHIGPKVRRIVQAAPFPVLIPSGLYKPWNSVTILYGGSELAAKALKLTTKLHQLTQIPLFVLSFGDQATLEQQANAAGVADILTRHNWKVVPGAPTAEKLFEVRHDSLVVLGAYGHGRIKSLFGSTMELVQSELPNPMLLVGPQYQDKVF